ncbi:hypothetical protein LINGRAHAP2_LOCUS955 [Linum grandiflorum]
MEEKSQVVVENRQSLEGRLDGLGQNHQQVTLQLKSLDERYESYNSRVDRRVGMGELPSSGRNHGPTFNQLTNLLCTELVNLHPYQGGMDMMPMP